MTQIPLSIEAVCGCVPSTVVGNRAILAELVGAAKADALVKVCDKDLRTAIAAQQAYAAAAPVSLLITADVSGPAYKGAKRSTLTHYDAGIVSGNIYLYCAANGLVTVCRGSMDRDALKKALNLGDKIVLHLNHPVGYPADAKKN